MQPPCAIDFDLPCITCGYNLRMQEPHALCPECASSVSTSLLQSPFNWPRRRLSRTSAAIMRIALGLAIPAGFLGLLIVAVVYSPTDSAPPKTLMAVFIFTCITATISFVGGTRYLTLPAAADPIERFDSALRVLTIVAMGAMGICTLAVIAIFNGAQSGPFTMIVFDNISLLFISLAAYFFLLSARLSRFCRRCNWQALAGIVRWALIAMAAGFAVDSVSSLIFGFAIVFSSHDSPMIYMVLTVTSVLSGLGSLLVLMAIIPVIVALFRMCAHLRRLEQRRPSAATWLEPPPEPRL